MGDFRSDTVTKPTAAMGQAMLAACLDADATGDDVMGEDATIRALEQRVAALLGKDAALFVPTCTMANLLAVGSQCARGDEVVLGTESHIFVYEQGGASWLMGAPFHTVVNAPDGTLPLDALRSSLAMRGGGADPHFARPGLVCIENTANRCGGAALPVEYMDALGVLAHEFGVPLHCDGARLLNAATALGVKPAALVAGCDTVSLCLSKGLGAPLGALLAGSTRTIAIARRLRKAVGGGMRQAGVVAAAGLAALDEAGEGKAADGVGWARMAADNARATVLAGGLRGVPGITMPHAAHSNIVYFALDAVLAVEHWKARAAAAAAAGRSAVPVEGFAGCAEVPVGAVPEGADLAAAFKALVLAVAGVKVGTYGTTRIRAVVHHQTTDAHVDALVAGAAAVGRLLSK